VVNTITKTIKAPTFSQPVTAISDLSEAETNIVKSLDSLFPRSNHPHPTPYPRSTIYDRPTQAHHFHSQTQSPKSGRVSHPPHPHYRTHPNFQISLTYLHYDLRSTINDPHSHRHPLRSLHDPRFTIYNLVYSP
jgi:hypothetical protein